MSSEVATLTRCTTLESCDAKVSEKSLSISAVSQVFCFCENFSSRGPFRHCIFICMPDLLVMASEFRCCDVQDSRRASIFAETKRSVCPAPFSLAPPEIVRANNLLCWLRGATEAPFPDAMEDQHASPDDSFENGYPGLDAETSQGFAQRPLNVRRRWAILTCGCVLNVTAPASDGATTDSVDAPGSTMPIATYHVLTGQVCQHMMALVRPVFRKEMLSPRWFDQETGEMQNLHLLTKD